MKLSAKRIHFTEMIAELCLWAKSQGYGVALAEVKRPREVVQIYMQQGKGIINSKHLEALAADIDLYKDGVYLADTESHRPLGEYWKRLDSLNRWGGDFKRVDGNHYEYGG